VIAGFMLNLWGAMDLCVATALNITLAITWAKEIGFVGGEFESDNLQAVQAFHHNASALS